MGAIPDITLYFPEHIKSIREFEDLGGAINEELWLLWDGARRLLDNRYTVSMDASECDYMERILGIKSFPEDSLEDRRRRIRGYTMSSLPYTEKKLREILTVLCGSAESYTLLVDAAHQTVHVGVRLSSRRLTDNVKELVRQVVPANMATDVYLVFNRWDKIKAKKWRDVMGQTWKFLHEGV